MNRIKLMFVFGTRPEAIKLSPLILQARARNNEFETVAIATAQHRAMMDDVLSAFGIKPDADMNIMTPGQTLFMLTSRILSGMENIMEQYQPDVVVVQGDTATAYTASLAGYYARKKVAHVEAGLRTGNKWAPFPEEIYRKMISSIADYHFAPTETSRQNLLKENYPDSAIHVTGNTVIDALLWMEEQLRGAPCPLEDFAPVLERYKRLVLITGHRRENFGEPFLRICTALREMAMKNPDVCFAYPVHLNPNVQKPVHAILEGIGNFFLLPPLSYPDFVWMMRKSCLIISDSGGVQEEAPALSKPVLVTRRISERPEAIEAGVIKLVGDDTDKIIYESQRLLDDPAYYKSMARGISPYGDGRASERILDILSESLKV